MKNKNELNYKQLKMTCDTNVFKFDTTDNLESITTGIGQDRGIKALEFGISVNIKGYNIYIEGPSGVGKTMYTKNYLRKIAKKKKVPQDWCYIYNFNNPNEPIAVSLQAGHGKEFKEDMESFIKEIKKDIKNTFNNDDFEKEKALIKQEYEEKREKLMEKLANDALQYSFQVKSAQNGIYMMPILDGKALKEEEFDKLDDEIKGQFEEKSTVVQEMIMDVIGRIKQIERVSDKKIDEWQSNVALLTVNVHINMLKAKYKRNKKINQFLTNVKKDVLKNVPVFLAEDTNDAKNQTPQQGPQLGQVQDPCLNYRVNLFVDNSELEGAPVIMDSNYSYQNMFGKLEYENYYGALKTDFTMLQAGLLHKANGGYLIVNVRDVLSNQPTWEAFKRVLRNQELSIDSSRDIKQPITIASLKPEPIGINMQVILIGSEMHYQQLAAMDADFKKLFKVKADFEDTYPRNKENIEKLARYIAFVEKKHKLLPFLASAVKEIVEYSSRCANDKNKLTAVLQDISDIAIESNFIAKQNKKKSISDKEVKQACITRAERFGKYNDNLNQMITDGDIIISTNGEKVGQINGLTIMMNGDLSFGHAVRVTANTFIGKAGVINIEREVSMSGNTHSKGVYILSAYIGEKYAQDNPL